MCARVDDVVVPRDGMKKEKQHVLFIQSCCKINGHVVFVLMRSVPGWAWVLIKLCRDRPGVVRRCQGHV